MTIFAQRKMNESKPARWQVWKILSGTSAGFDPSAIRATTVRLRQQAGRLPQTAIESDIMAVLRDEGDNFLSGIGAASSGPALP